MWKKHVREILLMSVFLIGAFAIGITSVVLNGKSSARNTTSAEASSVCKCTDDDVCYPDGCTREPKAPGNTFNEDRYNAVCDQFKPPWPPTTEYQDFFCSEHQPDCCQDMVDAQDSRMCCFMERWHCHPAYCDLLNDEGDCGKYWGIPDGWDEYGCVTKDANGNKIPKYGLPPGLPGGGGGTNPTSTPVPQNTATPKPAAATATPRPNQQATATPRANPTRSGNNNSQSGITIFPINSPIPTPTHKQLSNSDNSLDQPTSSPQENNDSPDTTDNDNTDSVALPGLNAPELNFELPKVAFKAPNQILKESVTGESIEKLNRATEPPLMAAENTLVTIKSYDQQLENTVEGWIDYVRIRITRLFQ